MVMPSSLAVTGAHAPARHRVARELGALAFEQIRQLHAERQCALVHERKREIDRALLIAVILLDADLGFLGHLRFAVADDLAHLADTLGNLHQRVGSRLLGLHHHHGVPPWMLNCVSSKTKKLASRIPSFEASL